MYLFPELKDQYHCFLGMRLMQLSVALEEQNAVSVEKCVLNGAFWGS